LAKSLLFAFASLYSLLDPASSTCVCCSAAREFYPTSQLAQAADAAPNWLAQFVPCSAEQFSIAFSVLDFSVCLVVNLGERPNISKRI
jgi:hypothetical protein